MLIISRALAYPQMPDGLVIMVVDDEDDIRLMVSAFYKGGIFRRKAMGAQSKP